jgi:hypothetical protein
MAVEGLCVISIYKLKWLYRARWIFSSTCHRLTLADTKALEVAYKEEQPTATLGFVFI